MQPNTDKCGDWLLTRVLSSNTPSPAVRSLSNYEATTWPLYHGARRPTCVLGQSISHTDDRSDQKHLFLCGNVHTETTKYVGTLVSYLIVTQTRSNFCVTRCNGARQQPPRSGENHHLRHLPSANLMFR